MNQESPPDAPQVPLPPALYPLFGIGIGYYLQRLLPLPTGKHYSFEFSGWFCFGTSILLIVWSLSTLRKYDTTAIPHKAVQHLIMVGPYRFSRNPVYLAFMLLVLASALASGNIWTLLTIPAIMFLLKKYAIDPEEAYLGQRFGPKYEIYIQKTRRWL